MLTPKESLRYLIDRQLGIQRNPSRERRLQEALIARRCRNVYFGAMAPVVYGASVPDLITEGQTSPFADPIIVTDLLDYMLPNNIGFPSIYTDIHASVLRVFVTGTVAPEDFFGAGNYFPAVWTLGHYRSMLALFGSNFDVPTTKMHFAPFILKPGSVFKASWELLDFNPANQGQFHGELHCRGVRVLKNEDPYGQLCGKLRDQVCGYIDTFDPETAIVDLTIPTADFPAAGLSRQYYTPLQDRPLLILGIASNINGAQIQMRDDSTQTNFVVSPVVPRTAYNGGAVAAGVYPANIPGLALYVVAANCDLTQHEAYNMLPVPHLLAPNTQLTIKLTNGLRPRGNAATFEQSMETNTSYSTSGSGPGHITFLCRTV